MRTSLQDLQGGSGCGGTPNNDILVDPTSDDDCDADEEPEADGDDDDLHSAKRTTLADIFDTVQAEIANRCMLGNPRVAWWFGQTVQRLIFW